MRTGLVRFSIPVLLVGMLLAAGCSDPPDPSPTEPIPAPSEVPSTLTLTSPVFEAGGWIPDTYTCEGADFSPPLSLGDVPGATRSLALVMDDPDAPGGIFDHWLIWNLPPDTRRIPPGLATRRKLEDFGRARQGRNDFGHVGYGGPCPPPGETHRYRFRVFALRSVLQLDPSTRKPVLMEALEDAGLARGDLTARYRRGERR